jgi:type IV pilus assembly protein PilV
MDASSIRSASSRGARQRGFTLLEALVAIVVLSIGLLGVAKLVLGAVHADDSAYMRGQATQLAYELLDQMRANRPGAIGNNYAGGAGQNNNCLAAACTPLQLAQLDEYNFFNRVAQALPAGTYNVGIAVDAFNDTVATISVNWDDSLAESAFAQGAAGKTVTLVSIL